MRPHLSIALVLAALGWAGATAPPPARYEVAPESRFWIDGTATTGAWTCEADDVTGHGVVGAEREVEAEVSVPVRDFDCGLGAMTRDLRRALGADAHPTIAFALDRAETLDAEARPSSSASTEIRFKEASPTV